MSPSFPKYRSDIDGLRAIAVLAVVSFHAFPSLARGGFIGVDIFFVISGFLISTIIFDSLERNSFSFVAFYSRRIRRIFPALLLVLAACFAFGWFALLADEYKQLGKHIWGGAGFVSNFIFWQESGYFDNFAYTKPLLHLWTLGIEEQFYIFWPLILWSAWKLRLNLLAMTAIIIAVSFALNIKEIHSDAVAAFYSPQTRFWELLTGSALAYVTLHKHQLFSKINQKIGSRPGLKIYASASEADGGGIWSNIQSIFGTLLIALGALIITKEKPFPGWWAVLPTLGSALVISAGSKAWLNRAVLSNRSLVWIGLISYPLYLWHWPLLSFAWIVGGQMPAPGTRIAIVLVSLLLAWLTYIFIERPIRFTGFCNAKTAVLIVLMGIAGFAGYYTGKRDGFAFRVRDFEKIAKAAGDWGYPGNLEPIKFKNYYFYFKKSGLAATTIFIGDSNIQHYYPRIAELIHNKPFSTNSVIFATKGNCPPIPNTNSSACLMRLQGALELTMADRNITNVVLGGQWFGFLKNNRFNYFDKEQEYPIDTGNTGYLQSLKSLKNYIEQLKANKKRVFLVLNIPVGDELDPKYMIERSFTNFPALLKLREGGIDPKQFLEAEGYSVIRRDLKKIATMTDIEVIDPMEYLCTANRCPSVDGDGQPIYKNRSHLDADYVRKKAFFIDSTVSVY